MKRNLCAGCGFLLPCDGYFVQFETCLYGSGRWLLCKSCHDHEEAEMEAKGTNDIPSLLLHYEQTIQNHQP